MLLEHWHDSKNMHKTITFCRELNICAAFHGERCEKRRFSSANISSSPGLLQMLQQMECAHLIFFSFTVHGRLSRFVLLHFHSSISVDKMHYIGTRKAFCGVKGTTNNFISFFILTN
jgi:hypothetical protein